MKRRVLCHFDALAEGEARGFELGEGDRRFDVFVLRRGGRILAYENRCPHAGTPLDLLPNRFLSADGRHLQCHTHGALFRIEDGMCVDGPCLGRSLTAVAVTVEDGRILIG